MDTLERKNQLIAQGALHRAEIVFARHAVMTTLRPQALAKGALLRLAGGALAAFIGRGAAAGWLRNLLPLLAPLFMRGASAFGKSTGARKSKLRFAPAIIAAAAAAAAFAIFSSRKREARRAPR